MTNNLPLAVQNLALRLGANSLANSACVRLQQRGRIRPLGSKRWMNFTAKQSISTRQCQFDWRARAGPFGCISVCDALTEAGAQLEVVALGFLPLVRAERTVALQRGELMRYLAELAWAPDAILGNLELRWREESSDKLAVSAGQGENLCEVMLGLDNQGRIASAFAPDRPRSAVPPCLPTPWSGRFWDYRRQDDRWIPFAGEVAWQIDGEQVVYWQGQLDSWQAGSSFP